MKAGCEMMDRIKALLEHTTVIHMFCILILTSARILNNEFYSADIYPALDTRSFVILSFFGLVVIFLLRSKGVLDSNPTKSLLSLLLLCYVTFPLVLAIITAILAGGSLNYVEVVLLLPVLIAASIMGKIAGICMATVCTTLLFVYGIYNKLPVAFIFESNLIVISMMYVIAWFIGGITEIESENRAQLKASIDSLKKEIIQRKKAEERLSKLNVAVEQSPSIVVITDLHGYIEYVNKKFTTVTGYLPKEVINRNFSDLRIDFLSREQFNQIWRDVAAGKELDGTVYNKKKNGDIFWESVNICPIRNSDGIVTHVLRLSEDVTEAKRMEKEMIRLDRLNLIGEMAAGLGHEIRNPMTSVRGFLQLFSSKKEFQNYKNYFVLMINELDRANSIISDYLSMDKDKIIVLEPKSLSHIIETIGPKIRLDAKKSGKKIVYLLEKLPPLLLDEKEIKQLIFNLVRNGLEAMKPGQTLTIKTYVEGTTAVLAVQDQGSGIKPEIMDKIGTPFFTTKDHGTGLGLAICYSIAKRHKAAIDIETGAHGTTFFVRFNLEQ